MGTWAPPLDPTLFVYTSGSATQFTDLAVSSLAGLGDAADTFDRDLAAFLSILPVLGAGIPGLDGDITAFESALADFNTDEFSPILADLVALGPGIDSAANALSLLGDFGSLDLSAILPWLNSLASQVLSVALESIAAMNEALMVYTHMLVMQSEIQELYYLLPMLGTGPGVLL